MPIYEYECQSCNKTHEIMQKFNDKQLTVCPNCGGKLKKIISNTSFILKGTGWYKTDYAAKPSETGKTTEDKKEKTETKTNSKTATATKA